MATYNIRTSSVQDWRDTMMSKAEFNALAAERRANRAGSGFDEWGKNRTDSGFTNVNDGISCVPIANNAPNIFHMGIGSYAGVGSSKTYMPYCSVNGVLLKLFAIGYPASLYEQNYVILPPAPTVLPYTATLTQQQIDSGVIKHADSSNSGLIVNGKFDTDTSGWTTIGTGTTFTSVGGVGTLTTTERYGYARQPIQTVVGKKYIMEFNILSGGNNARIYAKKVSDSTTLASRIGESNGIISIEFTAVESTTFIWVYNDFAGTSTFDNIAVYPSDAISRSDLVFLETWHEDISEKDFVYPLGNVQYLGTTGDAGTTVAGAFAGAATYSLFSDTWQADSALVGKGYVWSTLSDANKKAFVSNPENNCYLDGDKVIQVRYRMRVVMGWGDSWLQFNTNSYLSGTDAALKYAIPAYVPPKGKLVMADDLLSDITGKGFYSGSARYTAELWENGIFNAVTNAGGLNTAVAYEGKCFALPIALVHRRNQGIYNPVFNPNGRAVPVINQSVLRWYDSATLANIKNISDCFPVSYTAGNTAFCKAGGYIGYMYQASGEIPDGLFYNQIHESDITDLRMSSKIPTDYNRLIDQWDAKAIAGTYRGSEGEWSISPTYSGIYNQSQYLAYGFGNVTIVYLTGNILSLAVGTYYSSVTRDVQSDGLRFLITNTAGAYRIGYSAYYDGMYTRVHLLPTYGDIRSEFTSGTLSVAAFNRSTRTKSNTLLHCDIIGAPSNYPTSWKQSGVSGVPLVIGESGESLLPTGTTGSDGLAVYKLSKKADATPLQVLKSTDSGVTWTALTVTTHYTFSTTANAITFTAGNIPLTTDLVRVTYQTHTNMAVGTTVSEVFQEGKASAMNSYLYAHFISSLIGKVATANTSPSIQEGYTVYGYKIDKTTYKWSTVATELPLHTLFTLGGGATGVPNVKVEKSLSRSNGKARLVYTFKEIKHNGTSFGDDGKFNQVDNVSTNTDNNGLTVLIGTKYVELPYFIGDAE